MRMPFLQGSGRGVVGVRRVFLFAVDVILVVIVSCLRGVRVIVEELI